ncbi:MAG TPA: CheR family methyltransferase [Candidatus Binatia bacterium]|nr:CheR family methyltransferase [Candidatus Binatia bacterium]
MAFLKFEALLRDRIGLDPASIGSPLIERAVRVRTQACGLHDPLDYWEHVNGSERELQELIEAVVVPETWFFRHRESFAALAGPVLQPLLRARAGSELRFLSLPCSTGEEPYSLAMALLDAGLPPARFRVDAVDVSRRALRHARRGLYGANSFRGDDLAFRERHFTPVGGAATEWRIGRNVRAQVRFRHGNLFQTALDGPYDAVFFRNVLIYFDRPTQQQALARVTRLVAPHGALFVGPSETALLQGSSFAPAGVPLSFAFFRAPTSTAPGAARKAPAPTSRPAQLRPLPLPMPAATPRGTSKPAPPAKAAADAPLVRAARLADAGRLDEARRDCDEHIRAHGPSAASLYLLGLLSDAAGDLDGAAALYRKALYLDPHHGDALAHLTLLLEKRGDHAAARVLRGRAQRLAARPAGEQR